MGFLSNKSDFVIGVNGIDEVLRVQIGGIEQTILIQGEDRTNPVFLFLHGGPSLPIPGVSSKGLDYTIVTNTKELVKHYIVVFWDQRGTGKSYHSSIPKETMTIDQFVSDTIELTDYLRTQFNKEKIMLAGHSWGSIMGLRAVSEHPEKYYTYIGLSQIINWTENDRLSLVWTIEEARRRKNQKALKELSSVGEPPFTESFKQWGVLRKWQRNFGTLVYSDEKIKGPSLIDLTLRMLKEYSMKDMINTYYKGFKLVYTETFIKQLADFNFMESTKRVEVPISFIHGRKDVHVHGELVEAYFNQVEVPCGKQMIWMEKSSHVFHPEDTKLIEKYLIEQKRYCN